MTTKTQPYADGNTPMLGDTIELVNNKGLSADVGARAVVVSTHNVDGDSYILIVWIDKKSRTQYDGQYCPGTFKLIKMLREYNPRVNKHDNKTQRNRTKGI